MIARGTLSGDAGLEAEWRLFGTGPDIVDAFHRRELDIAYIGLPPAIIGIDKGIKIKCIAGGHVEGTVISGQTHYKGFPEINSLDDILKQFSGRKIGVPGKGSIHDVILNDVLQRNNIRKDIEVINFQWADQVLEAMHRGEVSAAVGTPALAAAVKRFAQGKILYPPFKLWPNNPSYGILAESEFLDRERALAEGFLELHEEAASFLRNRTAEAAGIIADSVGIVDEELVFEALSISPRYCACITDEYIASTMKFVKVLKSLGYIHREVTSGEIFDMSLIKKIHPEKDHYQSGLSVTPP